MGHVCICVCVCVIEDNSYDFSQIFDVMIYNMMEK